MADKERQYICHYVDNGSYKTMTLHLNNQGVKDWAWEFPDDTLELVVQ